MFKSSIRQVLISLTFPHILLRYQGFVVVAPDVVHFIFTGSLQMPVVIVEHMLYIGFDVIAQQATCENCRLLQLSLALSLATVVNCCTLLNN